MVPSLQRRQSCVVVRAGGETLVFDLGSGAVRGMLRADLDPFAIDRIFLRVFIRITPSTPSRSSLRSTTGHRRSARGPFAWPVLNPS